MRNTDKSLNALVELLGEDNANNLKEEIVNLIVEQVRSDLYNYGEYLIYPPDMKGLIYDAMESSQKKVEKMYKDAVIEINKDYIEKMKSYMAAQVEDPEKTMRREIIDLAKRLRYTDYEFGRNEKIANKLFEIAKATQEEMEI